MKGLPPALAHRVPPGQVLTEKWPVLTYGVTPRFVRARWTFRCFGIVEEERTWTWDGFLALPRDGAAVRHPLRHALVPAGQPLRGRGDPRDHAAGPARARRPLRAHSRRSRLHDQSGPRRARRGTTCSWRSSTTASDLTPDHGGPLRLVVPRLYFWKSAKWLRAFEFLDVNPPGFWEANGYHMEADPWKEERYADQETDAMQRMRAEAARRAPGSRALVSALEGLRPRGYAAGRRGSAARHRRTRRDDRRARYGRRPEPRRGGRRGAPRSHAGPARVTARPTPRPARAGWGR